MRHHHKLLFLSAFFGLCCAISLNAQTVRLKLEITNVWFNAGGDGAGNKPDPTWKVTAVAPYLSVDETVCVHRSGVRHGSFSRSDVIFDYNGVPANFPLNIWNYMTVSIEGWEDDRGGSCTYNCCGNIFQNDDDVHSTGSLIRFLPAVLSNQGSVHNFSVTTSSGHFRADLKLSLITLDVYSGSIATTNFSGANQSVFCEGDQYRVDSRVHAPPFSNYTLKWDRKVGNSWVNHTYTTNRDYIDVVATIPVTHYRSKIFQGIDETSSFRSTENLNLTVNPAPPGPNDLYYTKPIFCAGETGTFRLENIYSGSPNTVYNLTLSRGAGTTPINVQVAPQNLPYEFTGLQAGTYSLTVTAVGATGDCSTQITGISIQPQPLPNFVSTPSAGDATCNGQSGFVNIEMNGTSGGNNTYELLQGNSVVYTTAKPQSSHTFTGVALGTYTVRITNSNGCSRTSSSTVTVNEPPALTASASVPAGQGGFNIACNGDLAPVTITISGGNAGGYNISGSFGTVNNVFSGHIVNMPANGGGNTNITVTDTRGCSVTIPSGAITEPATGLAITINSTSPTAACINDGTVDFSASGGAGSFNYYVDNDNTNSNATGMFTGLSGGTHTAYVEDAAGCIETSTFNIVQTASIMFININRDSPTCYGYSDGALSLTGSGGTPPYEYSFDGGDNFSPANSITNIPKGTYDVVIRDSNMPTPCQVTQMITITEPAELFLTGIQYVPLSCNGELATLTVTFSNQDAPTSFSDGQIGQISLDGGATYENFPIDFPNGLSNNFAIPNWLAAGTYDIMFRNSDGCETLNSINLTVEEPDLFEFSGEITSQAESCFNAQDGQITASVTGGRPPYVFILYNVFGNIQESDPIYPTNGIATYTFTNIVPSDTPVIGNPTTGYAVGVMDGSAAQGADDDCPIVYPPSYDITDFFTLAGDEIMIGVAQGSDIQYGEVTNTGPPVNCLGPDGNGNNGELTITGMSGGIEPYEYSADGINYQLSNILTGLPRFGDVYVRDATGCVKQDFYFINESVPSVETAVEVLDVATECTGGSIYVVLSNGEGPYTVYLFEKYGAECKGDYFYGGLDDVIQTISTDDPTFIIEDIDAGSYEIAIIDEGTGCTYCPDFSMDIIIPMVDPIAISPVVKVEESCDPGGDGSVSFTISGGTPPYTSEINFADPQIGANPVFSGLTIGNYTFSVTDVYGCQVIFAEEVEPVTVLDLATTITHITTCAGEETGTLTVEPIEGTPPYTLYWDFDGSMFTLNAGETTTKTNLPAGEYEFTLLDNNGCYADIAIYLTEPDSMLLDNINIVEASCEGVDDGEVIVEYIGGTGNLSYALDGGTPQNNGSFTDLAVGSHNLVVTDDNGCFQTLEITVEASYIVTVDAVATNPTCAGFTDGSILFTPSVGSPLFWYSVNGSDFSTANPRSNLSAGTYEVVVRDGNGCLASLPTIIIEDPEPLSGIVTVVQDATCTTTTGQLMVDANGGTPPYTYLWDGNFFSTGNTLDNASGGDHSVLISDANGCSFTATGTIAVIPPVGIELSSSEDETCDQANGTITVSPISGTAPYVYTWSNGSPDNPTATNLSAGEYTVTVTDANTCTAEITITIENLPPPELIIVDSQNSICTDGNGSMTVEATGGTPPFMYRIDGEPLQASPIFENLSAGIDYLFTVVDSDGCENTVTGSIDLELPPTANLIVTQAACGMNDGAILASVLGGLAPYTYSWSPGGEITAQLNNLALGTYSVTITDANNCTVSATAEVTEVDALTINLESSSNEICGGNNGAATVAVSGGTAPYQYAWSIANPSIATVNNLPAGNQGVTVTDARGCTISLAILIEETEGPATLDFVVNNSICTEGNGSITATATGGTEPYTYSWGHNALLDSDLVENLTSGNYSLTVTDANGCIIDGTTDVLFIESPSIDPPIANNTVCENGNGSISINVVGGTPPYVYEWDQGIGTASATITDLDVGTYNVTVTDALGCTAETSASISIEYSPVLFEDGGLGENCGQQNGSLVMYTIGGTGTLPFTYTWSHDPDLDDNEATNLSAGTYSVTVTDANGCEGTYTAIVENIDGPALALETIVHESCGQMEGSATVMPTGGTPPYTYQWLDYPAVTGATLSGLSSGTYTVMVTDAANCTSTNLEIIIEEIDGPALTLLETIDDSCIDADVSATVEAQGGTLPYTYAWSHDNALNNPTASGLTTGNYMVSVTDANNCESVLSIDIDDVSAPTLSIDNVTDSRCGLNDGAISVIPTGGTPPYTFAWSDGDLPNSAALTGLAPSVYSLTLTDANACFATIEAEVLEYGAQELTVSEIIAAACNDNEGSITIEVSGGEAPFSYAWSHDNTLNAATANGLSAGDYTVSVTDVNGCLRTIDATVNTLEELLASITSSQNSNCTEGQGSISLSITGGLAPYEVAWSHDANETGLSLTDLSSGSYTATVTDANACIATLTQIIELIESPVLEISQQMNPDCGQTNGFVDVEIIGGTAPFNAVWSHTADTDLFQGNLDVGDYSVTVTDALGCEGTISVSLTQFPNLQLEVLSQTNEVCGMSNGTAEVRVLDGPGDYTYSWSHNNNLNSPIASGLALGNYTVTVTGTDFCPTPITITIDETTGPELGDPIVIYSDCNAATGSASFNVSAGTSPYTYSWSHDNALNSATANNLAADVYFLTVTDNNGCEDVDFAIVSDEDGPTISVTDFTNPSCLNNNGSITVEASGAVPPYTFSWSHNEFLDSPTADNLAEGGYFVTVTDANGCISILAQSLTIADPLVINVISQNNSICEDGNGSITIQGSGGIMPYTFDWSHDPTETGTSLSGLNAGLYSVTMTDGAGCTIDYDFELLLSDSPVISLVSNQNAICIDNGTITVETTGGTSPYTYSWSHDAALNSSTAGGLAIGAYTVTVTDANACTHTMMFNVDGVLPPNLSVISANPVCTDDNGTIEVQLTGGAAPYEYSWSHDPAETSNTVTGLSAGIYTITVTDANNCMAVITEELLFEEGPQLSIASQTNSLCTDDNGAIEVTVSGGTAPYEYNWQHDAGLNTPSLDNLSAGIYELTITDANACTDAISVTLEFTPGPNATWGTVTNAFCGDANGELGVLVDSGLAPYNFNWSHDNTLNDANATGLAPGDYSVTITDANGCETILMNSIMPQDLLITFLTIVQPSCGNSDNGSLMANVDGGLAPYEYNWSTGGTEAIISDLLPGNYQVTITDANGCQNAAEGTLLNASDLTFDFAVVDPLCNGDANGQVEVMATGGSGNYDYVWGIAGNPSTALITDLIAGDYEVTVSDDNGCSSIGQVNIPEPAVLTSTISSTPSCLNLLNGMAEVVAAGGTAPYTYSWDDPSGLTTSTAVDLVPDIYTVTVTDDNGCTTTNTVTISASPAVEVEISAIVQPDCLLNPTGSATVVATNGGGDYTYLWDDVSAQTTETASNLNPGVYNVTVTDVNGCYASTTAAIEAPGTLLASVSAIVPPACVGETNGTAAVQIANGSGNYSYLWNDADGQTSATLNNVAAGTYEVTVTDDDDGCFVIQEVIIPNAVPLSLDLISLNGPSCGNTTDGNVLVSAGGGAGDFSYLWDDSSNQNTAFAENLEPGTYNVTATDMNGCEISLAVTVPEGMDLTAEVNTFTIPTCFGLNDGSATVILTGSSGNVQYQWNDAAFQQTQTATGLSPGSYTVMVTDLTTGCDATAMVNMPVIPALTVDLLTTIQPSCSGLNDGSLTISVTGGTGMTTILWDDPAAQTTTTATGLTGGMYTVSVTDENLCQTVETFDLPDAVALSLSTDQVAPQCFNSADGSITASLTGGSMPYTFVWDDPAAQTNETAVNLTAGDYSVTATDDNGCFVTETVTLTTTAQAILLTETIAEPSCDGGADGAIFVAASGGAGGLSFNWNTGGATNTLENLTAADYTVTVTDNDGCAASATYTLTEGLPFVIDLGDADTTICPGEFLIYDFSNLDYQVSWSSDQGFASTDEMVLLEDAANYEITVTNSAGCVATDDVNLLLGSTAFQALFIVPTDVVITNDVVVSEVSWPMPDEVEWFYPTDSMNLVSTNQNQYIFNFDFVGEYDLTLRASAGGCEDWITKTIIVHADSTTIPSPFQAQPELLAFNLSPNPNMGSFIVDVELSEPKLIALSIFSLSGIEQDRRILDGATVYNENYNMSLTPGAYVCILQTPTQRKSILFTVVSP